MGEVVIDSFKGIAPKYGANLPVGYAEIAQNCAVADGRLAPLAKNSQAQADTNHYNSFAYHCETWYRQNNAFYCPWKIGVLDLLLYKDTSNYLKKCVSWIITKTDISFDAATKEIRSANGDFNVDSFPAGGTFIISGSVSNNGTFTVSTTATTTTVITVTDTVVNESAGASVKIKVCKEDYLGQTRQGALTTVPAIGYVGEGFWESVAEQYGSETRIECLVALSGEIYAGTYPHGMLLKWDSDNNEWELKAGQYGAETEIDFMVVYHGTIYGGTYPNGFLLRWDGISAWEKVADTLNAQTLIESLIVFDDKIYGGTAPGGKLFEWNGVDAWAEVADQYGTETHIEWLVELDDELYGCTQGTGLLLKWNGTDAWTLMASQYGAIAQIESLIVFNEEIYGGTATSGLLLKWNGVNAWTLAAAQLGAETVIESMVEYNETIYATTTPNGKVYAWNLSNAWIEVAPKYLGEDNIEGLLVLGSYLYGGSDPSGKLLRVNLELSERQYFYTLTRNIGGHIDESGPSTVSDSIYVLAGQSVTITKPAWTGLGASTYVTHWNIYRLSNETATWQLVAQVAFGTATYTDTVEDEDLGATCPSYYTSDQGNEIIWDLPNKNLDGITTDPIYGIIFGWKAGTLYWNEPGYPDAWIAFYNMNFPADIKNCIPFGTALGVLTANGPFRVDGNHPELLQQSTLLGNEPATSVLGCCKTKRGIAYLSDSGIVLFDMSGTSMITDEGFGEDWFKANVSSMGAVMIEVDNIGYLFHSAGGLIFDMRSDPPIATTLSEVIYGAYRKKDDESLYVMDGAGIQQFGTAAGTKAMTWKSGELIGDYPKDDKNFIEVETMSDSAEAVTVTTYVDGTSSVSGEISMDTVRNRMQKFLDTKCVGRAAQVKYYKAADDNLTPNGLIINEAIVRYTR